MNKEISLDGFVDFFPEIDLPVTLNDESLLDFSRENKPFTTLVLQQWIVPHDQEISDLTEYIPCFRLKDTADIFAMVYWRGDALKYEYIMVTFDKSGNLIDKKSIASTIVSDQSIKKSLATIDPDWIIHIVAGENFEPDHQYNSKQSRAFSMELLADGKIIFSLED